MATKFTKYEDVEHFISNYSRETGYSFVKRNTWNLGGHEIESFEERRLWWEDKRGNVPIENEGIPFVTIGHEVRECHQGSWKKAKERNDEDTDHNYLMKRRRMQVMKKQDCKATIRIRKLVKFPEYEISVASSTNARKRKLELLRSDFCSVTKQVTEYLVKVCGEHSGHVVGKGASYLHPIDKRVQHKIHELVDKGIVAKDDIKSHLKIFVETLPPIHNNSRCYQPSNKDLLNHIGLALQKNRYNPDDQRNLKVLVDKWHEESPDDLFHFQLSIKDGSSKQCMLFAHQTPFQQQLLLKYGKEFVLMDSTYKLTKYDCLLFLLVVQGNVGYFVVGLFMVEKETTEEIATRLNVIKSWNDKWVPKSFITDFDYREINALESVFSDFHREQSWIRWLKRGLHKNYMDEVLPLLRQIAYSKTENSCNDCIHKLQSLKVYQGNADLRNYIQNTWLNEKKRWVHYYRQQCSNMTVNTTNDVESQHKLLKYLYLKKMSTGRSLSAAMEVIVKEFIPDGKDKYVRKNYECLNSFRKYDSRVPLFLHNRPRAFVDHCLKRIGLDAEIVQNATEFLVKNLENDSISYCVFESNTTKCSCEDFSKYRWPCKHKLLVMSKFPNYAWEFLSTNYTQQPWFNLDYSVIDIADQPEQFQLMENNLTQSTTDDKLTESPMECKPSTSKNILNTGKVLLKQIENSLYLLHENDLTDVIHELKELNETIDSKIPTSQGLPIRKKNKKARDRKKRSKLPTKEIRNDNNACHNMTCPASGGCSVEDGKPTCFCKYGYELDSDGTQCVDIDECNRKVCQQQCVNTVGGFQCSCHPGYRLIGKSKCKACENSYFGENCESQCECLSLGAVACDSVKGCICAEGWTGDKCESDINECDIRNVCYDVLKMCRNTPGSFRCDCSPGYETKSDGTCQDIDECSSPALNSCSQTCLKTVGSFTCGCKEGFISVNDTDCVDIDECSLLIDECDQVCDNVPGSYNCFCKFGYKLLYDRKTCLQVEDPCKLFSNLTCEHYCLTTVDDAVCVCRNGYTLADDGQRCKDINECVTGNASGEQCSAKAICLNTDGSFLCQCPIGTKLENDGRTCSECDKHHYGQNCFNECSCLHGQCDKTKGCICYDGWVGTNCDSEIDPCATESSLCTAANTVCVSQHGMPHCICMAGYQNGSGHCDDVDECTASPPYCDQVCKNTVGSYFCDCQNGFQMTDRKCVDIDECQTTTACDQICENTAGGYLCSCEDGFKLDLEDRVTCIQLEENKCNGSEPSNCLNGTCVVTNGQPFCICDKGHELINHTCKDINECKVSVCDHNCTNLVGDFTCSCNSGSYLLRDGRTCKECKNGFYGEQCNKTCDCNMSYTDLCDTKNGTCYCKDGWEGDTCRTDIDECTADVHPCPANSACKNIAGTFICHCDIGFVKLADGDCEVCRNGRYGVDCKEECPCFDENTVSCNHVDGTCICIEGWNGNCSVDIDECESTPCTKKLFSECYNYDGSYSCGCPDGYLDVNGQCEDIDECAEGIDDCDYICNNINGSYTCSCKVGFGGSWNDCTECSENTYGQNCTTTCDCITNNAQNQHQTCSTVTGQCLCKDGWTGETCALDINECEDEDICVNIPHTACHNVKGSHKCSCLRGFEYDKQLECVRKSPEPTKPIDEDIYGRISTSIRIDILLPAGFNIATSAGFEAVSGTVKKGLLALYSSNIGHELLIVVTSIRLGSIIANYDIIYNKSDDTIIDELLTVTVDIATGTSVFDYDNQTVSVSSDTFGTNVELCDVYPTLIGTCGEGFKCDVIDGSVQCSKITSDDIDVLNIGIGAGFGVFSLILIVAGCVAKLIGDRRRKNKKTSGRVNSNALSGYSISDGTRNIDQFSWPTEGVINAQAECNRKLTWKSMFGYLSNGDEGPSKPVVRIPRPHVHDIHEPKLV